MGDCFTHGFGLARVRPEGSPIHPDEVNRELTDKQYLAQLQAYKDYHGFAVTRSEFVVRSRLLDKLK